MPKTAVINPRRDRRGRFVKGGGGRRRRRRNPSSSPAKRRRNPSPFTQAAYAGHPRTVNRRRRRRSYYGSRRRRNPGSSITRRKNPALGLDEMMDMVPGATLGVQAARYATAVAGPYDAEGPGIGHAIAWWIAAKFGGELIGSLFGSPTKGHYATIAALGWAGDQLLWRRLVGGPNMSGQPPSGLRKWAQENMYLGEVEPYYLGGFEQQSALGASEYVDALGNRYVSTPEGWGMAGDGQLYQGEDGQLYLGEGYEYPADYYELVQGLSGFQQTSPIGGTMRRGNSTFGYG